MLIPFMVAHTPCGSATVFCSVLGSVSQSVINQSMNQTNQPVLVHFRTQGRGVVYRSACFQVDFSGLGWPGWELQLLEFSPSAQLGDAFAPCAALQGLKYRYTAHWHDPLARAGI